MANVRWNFRLGPLQLTSPFGMVSAAGVAGLVLCCCGAGIIGASNDSPDKPPPAVTVVETPAPATPDATEPAEAAEPAETAAARPVTAGAFCDTAGETGATKAGTKMVCRGPGDLRWRKP